MKYSQQENIIKYLFKDLSLRSKVCCKVETRAYLQMWREFDIFSENKTFIVGVVNKR